MFGIATSCWFVANRSLSEPVAFPIMTTLPAVIAAFVGKFVFKEIEVSIYLENIGKKSNNNTTHKQSTRTIQDKYKKGL